MADRHFRIAFSKCLGNVASQSQANQTQDVLSFRAESLLASVSNYLTNFKKEEKVRQRSILREAAFSLYEIDKRLGQKERKYKCIELLDYGGTIILQKQSPELFTNIYLIYCPKWQMRCNVEESEEISFNGPEPCYDIQHIGQVQNTESLTFVYNCYLLCLQKEIQIRIKNDEQRDLASLIKDCRKALDYVNQFNLTSPPKQSAIQLSIARETQNSLKLNFLKWSMVWGLVYFHSLQDSQLTEILIVDYKLDLLRLKCEQQLKIVKKSSYEDLKNLIAALMVCYQQLRAEMQLISSQNNIYYSNEKCLKSMLQIGQLIHKLDCPQKQIQLELAEVGRHYDKPYLEINAKHLIPPLTSIINNNQQSLKGISNDYIISTENTFRDLLQKHDQLEFKKMKATDKSYEDEEILWLMAVEDSLFTMAYNQLSLVKPFKKLNLSLLRMQNSSHVSQNMLVRLFRYYRRKMIQKMEKYAYNLECQVNSHIELMKAILCIIGFEVFKKQYKNSIHDISDFRLPIDYHKLYNQFNSLSHMARKAMLCLFNYAEAHKQKQDFFNHTKGYNNMKIYALKVAMESGTIKNEVDKKMRNLKRQKQVLREKIIQIHEQVKEGNKKISTIQKKLCLCPKFGQPGYQLSLNKCQRCKAKDEIQWEIYKLKIKTEKQIQTSLPENDALVHQFFYSINSQLEGLINMALICQHSDQNPIIDKRPNENQLIVFRNGKLKIKTEYRVAENFRLFQKTEQDVDKLVKYSEDRLKLAWNGNDAATINYKIMSYDICQQIKQIKQSLYHPFKQFLQNPQHEPDRNREHFVYAKIGQKPTLSRLEQFLALGSTRVGRYTQLIMCMKGLLSRSLGMDVLSGNYEFVKYIVYRSIASIQVTKPQQLLESANIHLDEGSRYSFEFFMANYIEEWKSQDFNSLPLIGPILSLISRIINDEAYEDQDDQDPLIFSLVFSSQPIDTSMIKPRKVIKKVVKKIKEQYERLEKDIIAHAETQSASVANKNRQNQYFVCFGGICCFTQLILNDEHDTCIDFIKLLVMMKIKQTYLGSLNRQEKSKYQEVVKKYSTFKFRAIQNNIRVALKYIENNINKLTEIVQIVDESAKQDLRWQKDSDGPYVFRGTDNWENIYKIDIKTGKVIKNGQSISRVPEAFKRMTQYRQIFGNRDFEVFPSQGKDTMQTKRNFVDLFLGNLKKNDTALFEFGYVNNEPTINLVFRYQDEGKSQTWRLLQSHILLQQLPIPKVYSQKYYAWYCQEISCIVFRKPNLQNIGEVALVIFLEKTPHWKKEVTHSHVISRQNYRASMDIICNPKEKNFDKLILRKNLQKQSQAYQILSRIEKIEYILELEGYQNNERKFWLHRYDYMFIQNKENGLIPQGYKNYRVSKQPFSNDRVPWKEADNISCLVLEKIIFTEATQLLHNYKILIPEWLCDQHGHINIPNAQDINETKIIYAYDIHDHYGDIRGIDRISQIHLASILAAINKNVRDGFAKMTPLEYSMKILKSCYNNIPLSQKQTQQIKNLLAISACQHSESLALMCYALLKCTREIDTLKKQTISFMIKIFSKRELHPQINIQNFISMMTTKYCSKLKNRLIPLRQILPPQIARLLGIKEIKNNKGRIKNWRQVNKLCYRLPANSIEQFINKYTQVLQQWSKINLQIVQGQSSGVQNKNKSQKVFPLDVQNPEENILLSEVQTQLKKSYDAYRKTKDHIASVKIQPKQLNQKFKLMLQKLTQSKKELQKLINGVCLQNHQHIDILTAYQPILSSFDFVNLLIEGEHNISQCLLFDNIFPDFNSEEEKQQFKLHIMTLVKMWTLFCVKINSCQRILLILKHQLQDRDAQPQTDKIALFRQCQSPRAQIQDRIHWVCFQAEMKIQIWKSQFETFNSLVIKNASGSVSQLNMGQGKTQVIIPMITLQLFYGKNLQDHEMFKNQQKGARKTPRVNLMQSLLSQSKVNYFKFLSITSFNIPLTVLPFDRGVNFKNDICLKSIIRSLSYFKNKMIILLDQSSTHSLMLKLKEETLKRQGGVVYNKETDIFKEINPFDIFDQVDAQLIPKKSFIYSVGKSSTLDELQLRISIAAGLIQTIQSIVEQKKQFYQFFTYDESEQDVHNSIRSGQFPKGLRLISNSLSSQDLVISFRQFVFLNFIKIMDKNQGFEFLKMYNQQELGEIINYVIKEQSNQNIIPPRTNEGARKILYIFRGYLAYGVFQHCLYLRFNVHHGVPDSERKIKKRLAVPYEAADIPSKKNDYAHPDVAILLTLLAYYSYGLNIQQSIECLDHLIRQNSQNHEAKNLIYQKWHSSLSDKQRKYLKVASTSQVQLHSHTQRERLWTTFKKNRSFIYFWLQNKVFPKDMIQFVHSITSSSWDHADVQACIGFSGTKDNSRLLPTYVRLIQSENLDILGTDGKMLDLMIQNVLDVVQIGEGNESLWERFLQDVLKLSSSSSKQHKIGSIIDAGALLASKSLKNHIVPWLASNQKFINLGYKGICFCNDNQWKVYKLSSHQHIDRGTSIPDSETFVVYDEYRTRGADIKMDANVVAILTLSSTITKDSLMQAVGRLRKLGRNQKLIIFMTKQVKFKIKRVCKYRDDMSAREKVKTILEWSCLNSVAQNEKYFLPNAKLAKIHYANKQDPKRPFVDKTETGLKKMYSEQIRYQFIANVCNFTLDSINQQKLLINEKMAFQKLRQISTLYGKKGKVKNLNFQAVCQRQTQVVQQTHEELSIEKMQLSPIPQIDQIKLHSASNCFGFKFSYKLQISQNFSRCTSGYSVQIFSKKDMNQLMNVQFVWLKKDSIAMITQREAHKLLTSTCLPVYQTDQDQKDQKEFIAKISDLSINDKFIKKYKLQTAYVHCKFYNGCSIFNDSEEQRILRNLIQNQENKKQRIKFFIDKRRQSYKFKSSTLEKILRDTESMPDHVPIQADNDHDKPKSSQSYMQLLQQTEKFRQQALQRHKQTGKGSSTNLHGQQEKKKEEAKKGTSSSKLKQAEQQEQQSSEEDQYDDNSEEYSESNEEYSNDG